MPLQDFRKNPAILAKQLHADEYGMKMYVLCDSKNPQWYGL